jgi:hypothetical protein
MKNEINGGVVAFFLVVCLFASIGAYMYLTRHERHTREQVAALVKTPMDDLDQTATLTQRDAWGNELHFSRLATKTYVQQTIVSAGKDGKFGTDDDIRGEDIDWNKSRIVGKWVGNKAKEFVKGLKDGEESQSRFEKLTAPEPTTKPSLLHRIRGKFKEE